MAVQYKARVWEVGGITGAGPYNLPNTANAGAWRTFAGAGLASGSKVVACVQDTVTNAWELSLWTYTAGSPGTLARAQFLESSTGSAITFAGNSCNITLEVPSPAVVSSGAASSGLVPAAGASGVLDSSWLPTTGAGPDIVQATFIGTGSGGQGGGSATLQNSVGIGNYLIAVLAGYAGTLPTTLGGMPQLTTTTVAGFPITIYGQVATSTTSPTCAPTYGALGFFEITGFTSEQYGNISVSKQNQTNTFTLGSTPSTASLVLYFAGASAGGGVPVGPLPMPSEILLTVPTLSYVLEGGFFGVASLPGGKNSLQWNDNSVSYGGGVYIALSQ